MFKMKQYSNLIFRNQVELSVCQCMKQQDDAVRYVMRFRQMTRRLERMKQRSIILQCTSSEIYDEVIIYQFATLS